jgi:transposase
VKHQPDTRYNKPINYDEEYKNFYNKIKKYKIDDIIANDETSVSVELHLSSGREIIGKRLDKITTDNKVFVKYTLIMAITTHGVLDWILYEKGGSDHVRLIEFIKLITKNKTDKLILMDNASCHRNEIVKTFITNTKNDYVYIFPYNHSMNSIERYFNQLKYYMKKDEPMSYELIKTSIKNGIKKIRKESYENYFKSSLTKNNNDIEKSKTRYIKNLRFIKNKYFINRVI